MPWKTSIVMEERTLFVNRLRQGERMTDLCREYGIARKTGYKFLGRYEEYGHEGLYDESRSPHRVWNRTTEEIEGIILETKRKHPTWGAKKIREILERRNIGVGLPVKNTVHNVLERNGLVKKRKRRRGYPGALQRITASQSPNDVWCADYKGQFRMGNGNYCYPLTITDNYSRYLLGCEGFEEIDWRAARRAFEMIFREYGMPQIIRTDNGGPFASLSLAGLSRLSVWWLKLGIQIERIERGHPEQNSRHERMHLTLKEETTRPAGANLLQQQERFDCFKEEYNNVRPHEALDMKCPCEVYHASQREYPEGWFNCEYPLHDISRRVSKGGRIFLRSQKPSIFIGSVFCNEMIGLREIDVGRWLVTFASLDLGYIDERTWQFEPMEWEQPMLLGNELKCKEDDQLKNLKDGESYPQDPVKNGDPVTLKDSSPFLTGHVDNSPTI